MARPPRWQTTLDASIQEACLAVRLYNDSAENRAFEGFVIHMHLAWLYLLHAEFIRDGVDYRYWQTKKKNRLEKVDGEPKRWELERSVRERWPKVEDPVRANISLFIRLRNRIEHRHSSSDESLMLNLSGHSHALLLNYEEELTHQFGHHASLATQLRLPIFVGTFTPDGEAALRRYRKSLSPDVRAFLTEYESGLPSETSSDPRYEFRLRATIELAPKDPDAISIQFTHSSDLSAEDRDVVERLGKEARVLTRDRIQPVSGYGKLLATAATKEVNDSISFEFNRAHFVQAWKINNVRPETGDKDPHRTQVDFCEYDEPTKTYRYTRGYVKYLVKRCATPEGFEKTTGRQPKIKTESPSTDPSSEQGEAPGYVS